MALTPVFVSFDYDHDLDLKNLLIGQARHPDTPFAVSDHSVKLASPDWKADARRRIRMVDQVIVLCGEHTHTATGVSDEVRIAQDERVPYFLLWGRSGQTCTKPAAALPTDTIYQWTWDILKQLVGGAR